MREGWSKRKIDEIATITMGQSPSGNSINETEGVEFHQGKIYFGEKYIKESHFYTSNPIRFAEPNSLLLCVRAPIGVVNITDRKICIGRGLCSIKANDSIHSNFLYYALRSQKDYFNKNATGSTFLAISSNVVKDTQISFPSKDKQIQIASELDKITEISSKYDEQLKELDKLSQSIFYEMFGDPVENEKGWESYSLEKVCSSIVRGPFGSALKKEYFVNPDETTYKVYEQKHAIQKDAEIGNYYITKEKFNELSRFEVKSGDIIMSCSGTIGELYAIPSGSKKGLINQALLKFTLNEKICVSFFLFLMDCVKKDFTVRGTGLQNIGSVNIIKAMEFGLPPLPLQQSFARKIEAIEAMKSKVREAKKEAETLLAARMQYWFE